MFKIERVDDGIELIGRFDASHETTAMEFLEEIDEPCAVECRQLEYISSAGLSVLLVTQQRLSARGHGLRLRNVNPHIRELLRVSGIEKFFEFEGEAGAPHTVSREADKTR